MQRDLLFCPFPHETVAIPLERVISVVEGGPVTPLPYTAASFEGLVEAIGQVMPQVDLGALLGLEIVVSYGRYARVLRWLTLSLVAYVAVLAVLHIDWSEVARATFLPRITLDRTSLAALIAIFGTTISPYLFFWQASEEAEEEELELDHGGAPVDGDHVAAMRGDGAIPNRESTSSRAP